MLYNEKRAMLDREKAGSFMQDVRPSVSVLVPIYNVEHYLRQCLDSLRAQELDDIEFICVDDGSTDGSLAIARDYEAADARFKVISKPNAGYGHTLNCGFNAARGAYVGVVESDDFCSPEMFSQMLEQAVRHDADIVRSSYYLYWSAPEERVEFVPCLPSDESGIAFDPRELPACFLFPPALWTMLVRRSLVVDNGLRLLETPGASYQDTAFSFKLWACARRALVMREGYLHYRQDNEASSINQKGKLDCVPREYGEIERFLLADEPRFGALLPIMMKRKFSAYRWNYERMAAELHGEFARLASREFRDARDRGMLSQDLFSSDEWSDLALIIRDPERFVALRDAGDEGALRRFHRAERVRRTLRLERG